MGLNNSHLHAVFNGYEAPYYHKWPTNKEEYQLKLNFNIFTESKQIPASIAIGERNAFGIVRKRILVMVKSVVVIEFTGTDNYLKNGLLVGPLKYPNSEKMYETSEIFPNELKQFDIVHHKDYIKKGFNRLAILANISEFDVMINYAIYRAKSEELI